MDQDSGKIALGIDLGGTKILTAAVNSHGEVLARNYNIIAEKTLGSVIESVADSAQRSLTKAGLSMEDISAIGLGVSGLSNPDKGVLLTSPHLPGFEDTPMVEIFEKRFGNRPFMINDANAAAIGEMNFGAARGARNLVYVTLSTGIGAGIIFNGEIFTGAIGTAGEAGHMTIDDKGPLCECGNRGCWETLASGTALARDARLMVECGRKTSILDQVGGNVAKITAEAVHKAALEGDKAAGELIARTGYYFGVGLANLVNLLNPEIIVIGGGLSKIGDMLLKPAYEEAGRRAFKQPYNAVRFAVAGLGDESCVVGAAAFALGRSETA